MIGGANAEFDLNGILITSNASPSSSFSALVHVPATDPANNNNANALSLLRIKHCTLVPGWALSPQGAPQHAGQPALIVEPAGTQAVVQLSILGSVQMQRLAIASISDSIVDANGLTGVAYAELDGLSGGGALTLQGCTVIGKVHATLLTLVSDCILWAGLAEADTTWKAPLWADRKQQGCVNFSYLPEGAITPRQYECVVEGPAAPGPLFEVAALRRSELLQALSSTPTTACAAAPMTAAKWAASISCCRRSARPTCKRACRNICRSDWNTESSIKPETEGLAMSFDCSRFPFRPGANFSGVVMQQGRVQLDSDWNEWLAEITRRIQAGTLDTFGRTVVPATTPDAFFVT